MPRLPDKIIDQKAVKRRNNLYVAAATAAVIGFGGLYGGATGLGVIASIAAGLLVAIGNGIKTEKHFQGGGGLYR